MYSHNLDDKDLLEKKSTTITHSTATAVLNMNSSTSTNGGDEGYVEQRFEAPDFMTKWTEEQKAEFAYQLLLSIPTSRSLKIVDRLGPLLHRDFFSMLPYELAVYILSHVDALTVIHVGQVSRHWRIIAEDQSLWKQLYIDRGWQYDERAIRNYLDQPSPSPSPTKRSNSNTETRIAPVPLARTNASLYDPTALPTMPGAPHTSGRLRPLRRPGDIFLRFRQRRQSQHPSAGLSVTMPSSSTPSTASFTGMNSVSPPPSLSSPLCQPQVEDQQRPTSITVMSTSQRVLSPDTPSRQHRHLSSSSSSTTAAVTDFTSLVQPTSQHGSNSSASVPFLSSSSSLMATELATDQQSNSCSIKRGSKLLLYDTLANRRNNNGHSAESSTSSPHSTLSASVPTESRLPIISPSLSTVPSAVRRVPPSPAYTRISVSSNLRPTSPSIGAISSSVLYQRRQQQSSTSSTSSSTSSPSSFSLSRNRQELQDRHGLSSPSSSPSSSTGEATQHRVVERRPFKNRPISRQHVHYDETALYHYQEDNDRRFINWRRLYRNQCLIDKRWSEGQYWMRTISATAASSAESSMHTDWIYCLQFNTKILVSGSRDRTLKVWDINTSECLYTLHGHEASVLCLQFDDRYIVSGSSDATMIVWGLHSGKKVRALAGHSESVLNLRFNGGRLVSSSKDRTIRVWDLETGKTTQVLRGHRAAVNAVQFKDDMVVSASGDRTIRLWNATTGACIRTFDSHSRGIACVEFDGQYIVSGSSDQTIKIWNMSTGECLHTLTGHRDLVRTLQMDRRLNKIVSGSYDGTVRVWNMNKGSLVKSLDDNVEGRVLNLQFDYTKIVCCTNMSKIFIYDFAHGVDTQFLA